MALGQRDFSGYSNGNGKIARFRSKWSVIANVQELHDDIILSF